MQEAKTAATEVPGAEQTIRNAGWKMAILPCSFAPADGKSAGGAIGTRCHVGMKDSIKAAAWLEEIKSRFTLKHIAVV